MSKTFGRSVFPKIKQAAKYEHGSSITTQTHTGKKGGGKAAKPKK